MASRPVTIVLCILVLAACAKSDIRVAKLHLPKTESECVMSGGNWQQDFFRNFYCFMHTTDGGKRCTSSEQCQWACLGPQDACLGPQNAVKSSKLVGACSENDADFGNVVYVENGNARCVNVE